MKIKESAMEKSDSASIYLPFVDKAEAKAGKSIKGVILNCHLDKTHPLCWGLDQDEIAVIKNNNIIFEKDKSPYVSPLYYSNRPLLSGFLSADNMNFRSYFFGTSKIFMNAIFYGRCM